MCGVPSFHMGGRSIDAPSFAIGDDFCAFGTKLMVGSYFYPTGTTMFYVQGNSILQGNLHVGGNLTVSGSTSGFDALLSPYATTTSLSSSLSFPSGLTVSGGGATITGDSSINGGMSVSGALSGAGVTAMLAPYALAANVPPQFYAFSPLIGTLQISGHYTGQFGITFDTTKALVCSGVTTSGGLTVSSGNASIAGTLTSAGLTSTSPEERNSPTACKI